MEKIKVLVKAPILTISGYGEHARFIMRALKSREDIFDIYAIPVPWGQCRWMSEDTEERRYFDEIFKRTMQHVNNKGSFDLFLHNVIPNEFERLAPINVGVTSGLETNMAPQAWIDGCNKMNKTIVESEHAKNSLQASRVPFDVVSFPAKKIEPENLDINLETDFNFLVMSQAIARKGIDTSVVAFLEEFKNEKVGLVLKLSAVTDSLIQKEKLLGSINKTLQQFKDRVCKLYLLFGNLSDGEMSGLFTHPKIKAFVTATHGEAFYIPLFDAACCGLPVIAPAWSGYTEYMTMPIEKNGKIKNRFIGAKVDYILDKIHPEERWQGVYEENQIWCYPSKGSMRMKMREMFLNYSVYKSQAEKLKEHLLGTLTPEKQYEEFVDSLIELFPERIIQENK